MFFYVLDSASNPCHRELIAVFAAVIWLTVPRVLRTMKGDGEQEETQSNGRRSKAFSATMFLIGHRFGLAYTLTSAKILGKINNIILISFVPKQAKAKLLSVRASHDYYINHPFGWFFCFTGNSSKTEEAKK